MRIARRRRADANSAYDLLERLCEREAQPQEDDSAGAVQNTTLI